MIFRKKRVSADGRFRFDRELGSNRWLGTELVGERQVLISELPNTDLSIGEMRTLLAYDVDGVAKLLALDPITSKQAGIPDGALLVEELPHGTSLAQARLDEPMRAAVALDLAVTVSRASHRGIALVGLRPDLIIAGASPTIVPRSVLFLARRSTRVKFTTAPWVAGDSQFANFVDPDADLMLQADVRSDVYLLGLVISWLWNDRHAFAGVAASEYRGDVIEAMRWGTRDPWPGPPALDALLTSMIVRDPERRVGIDEVVATLHGYC